MTTSKLIKIDDKNVSPLVLWGYGVMFEIRNPPTMPPDFPRRPDDVRELVDEIWTILNRRQASAPAEVVECGCGRDVPGFSDLEECPFCGIEWEAAEDEDDEDEAEVIDAEVEEASKSLVPHTAPELAKQVAESGREARLEEVESEIAKWSANAIRAGWERGRLLKIVKNERLYTLRGCKNFMQYLSRQPFGSVHAYSYMALHDSCPEETIDWCDGLSFTAMMQLAHQAKSEVERLSDGAKYLHGVFRQLVGEAKAEAVENGELNARKEPKRIAEKALRSAAKKPGTPVAKVKAKIREQATAEPSQEPAAPSNASRRGRPRKSKLEKDVQAKIAKPPIATMVKSGLDNMPSHGGGSYINADSGRPIARPAEIIGRCIHIQGTGGKFLRITLSKHAWKYTIETAP